MKNAQDRMTILHLRFLGFSLVLVSFVARSEAADVHWINPNGGNWNVAANWNTVSVPGSNDIVYVDYPGTYTVNANATDFFNAIHVGNESGTSSATVSCGIANFRYGTLTVYTNALLVSTNYTHQTSTGTYDSVITVKGGGTATLAGTLNHTLNVETGGVVTIPSGFSLATVGSYPVFTTNVIDGVVTGAGYWRPAGASVFRGGGLISCESIRGASNTRLTFFGDITVTGPVRGDTEVTSTDAMTLGDTGHLSFGGIWRYSSGAIHIPLVGTLSTTITNNYHITMTGQGRFKYSANSNDGFATLFGDLEVPYRGYKQNILIDGTGGILATIETNTVVKVALCGSPLTLQTSLTINGPTNSSLLCNASRTLLVQETNTVVTLDTGIGLEVRATRQEGNTYNKDILDSVVAFRNGATLTTQGTNTLTLGGGYKNSNTWRVLRFSDDGSGATWNMNGSCLVRLRSSFPHSELLIGLGTRLHTRNNTVFDLENCLVEVDRPATWGFSTDGAVCVASNVTFSALSRDTGVHHDYSSDPYTIHCLSLRSTQPTLTLLTNVVVSGSTLTTNSVLYVRTLDLSQLATGSPPILRDYTNGLAWPARVYYLRITNPNQVSVDASRWIQAVDAFRTTIISIR